MKKLFLFTSLVFIFLSSAFAHSPRDILLEVDFKKNKIKVEILHQVGRRHHHYIRKVKIKIDQRKPLNRYFFFQRSNTQQTFWMEIPDLDSVGKITIRAYCKKGGILTKDFNLKELRQKDR